MKNAAVTFLTIITLLSCKKEEVIEPEQGQIFTNKNVGKERHEPKFGDYESELKIQLGSANSCNNPHSFISIAYHYKLEEGVMNNENYFYHLYRKTDYLYPNNYQVQEWHNTGILYRYDYQNKKAYIYSSLNDPSPKLLMDFNLEVGDQIEIPESGSKFNVDSVGSELINGQQYPLLYGHLIIEPYEKRSGPSNAPYNIRENHSQWYENVKSSIQLSPYYPNPLYFDHTMDYYWSHDWSFNDFEGGIYLPYHFGFQFRLKSISQGSEVNDYYVVL
ncbi:MAG: hypothetical protein WDZ35_09915 [Crocinitomicaceae bacterium]